MQWIVNFLYGFLIVFFYSRFRLEHLELAVVEKTEIFQQIEREAGDVDTRLNEARAEMELAKKNLTEYDFYYFLKIFSLWIFFWRHLVS